jgi:hypothetical protein
MKMCRTVGVAVAQIVYILSRTHCHTVSTFTSYINHTFHSDWVLRIGAKIFLCLHCTVASNKPEQVQRWIGMLGSDAKEDFWACLSAYSRVSLSGKRIPQPSGFETMQ